MNVEFYLVSATRHAHRLKTGRSYLFGRDTACEIPLQDALASRRHAELRWNEEDQVWELLDLASRNGVMVNNVRINANDPIQLEDSDQIQIGGQVYRYHLLPPGSDPSSLGEQAPQISNVETMGPGFSLADLANQGAAFTGAMTDGVLDMLSFLLQTRKTGRIDMVGGAAFGSVWVKQGSPVHATYGPHKGIDAVVQLTLKPPPRFAFHNGSLPEEITLQGAASAILMEVARQADEQRRA